MLPDSSKPVSDKTRTVHDYSSGLVSIEITHTERTWADDMMGMLEKSLDEIWTQQSKLSKTMRFLGKVVTSDITYLLLLPDSQLFFLKPCKY